MERALGYVRVSTAEQAREGTSLDAQEARIRAYCKMSGLSLVNLIREEGVSAAKSLANRPGGQRIANALAKSASGSGRAEAGPPNSETPWMP